MTGNPFLIGVSGPGVLLPARVCRVLQHELGRELSALRVRARGVDQETAYALMAIQLASAALVPVEEHVSRPVEEPPEDWYMSTTEVAERLHVSRRAIGQAIARGTLPATKVGRAWRVRSTDVQNYRAA